MKKLFLKSILSFSLLFSIFAEASEHPLMSPDEVSLREKMNQKQILRLLSEDQLKVQSQLSNKPGLPKQGPQPGEEIPHEAEE